MVELVQWTEWSTDEYPFGERWIQYDRLIYHPRFYYAPNNILEDLQMFSVSLCGASDGGDLVNITPFSLVVMISFLELRHGKAEGYSLKLQEALENMHHDL